MKEGIAIENLTMGFGRQIVLEDVNLHIAPQRIYGLLGRNGAGKTTLIQTLSNCRFPFAGNITLDGTPIAENDALMGRIYAMGVKSYFPEEIRVRDMFRSCTLFYPGFDMDYALRLAEAFQLPLKKRIKALSTGYGTISKIIMALACGAPYVFLDEPVLGLDANHRELFYRELLRNYSETPRTFILSTHLISEIAALVEHVFILHERRIVVDCPIEEVQQRGYSVSGRMADVDAYCQGREVFSSESLGTLKTAWLTGTPGEIPDTLELGTMQLQEFFVRITETGGVTL